MPSLHIVYASTSGHTEYVLGVLSEALKAKNKKLAVTLQRAEQAKPEDLIGKGSLLLACGTWNTGGIEGQLNPHMHLLLKERAKEIDLQKRKVIAIGLGDSRYRYTANALNHLKEFVTSHNGTLVSSFRLVNEPYGQEDMVKGWAIELLPFLTK